MGVSFKNKFFTHSYKISRKSQHEFFQSVACKKLKKIIMSKVPCFKNMLKCVP